MYLIQTMLLGVKITYNLSAAAANLVLSNIPSTIGAGAAGSGIGALIAGIIANLTKGKALS